MLKKTLVVSVGRITVAALDQRHSLHFILCMEANLFEKTHHGNSIAIKIRLEIAIFSARNKRLAVTTPLTSCTRSHSVDRIAFSSCGLPLISVALNLSPMPGLVSEPSEMVKSWFNVGFLGVQLDQQVQQISWTRWQVETFFLSFRASIIETNPISCTFQNLVQLNL